MLTFYSYSFYLTFLILFTSISSFNRFIKHDVVKINNINFICTDSKLQSVANADIVDHEKVSEISSDSGGLFSKLLMLIMLCLMFIFLFPVKYIIFVCFVVCCAVWCFLTLCTAAVPTWLLQLCI